MATIFFIKLETKGKQLNPALTDALQLGDAVVTCREGSSMGRQDRSVKIMRTGG